MKQRKIFFGWFVVAGCFLLLAVPSVFLNTTWYYYMMPIVTDMGSNYVQFSLSGTVATIATMVFSFFCAGWLAKGNTRLYVFLGALIGAVMAILKAYCTSMTQIIIVNGIQNFALAAAMYVPINILLSMWFIDKKGLATSIAYAGSPVGSALFTTLISNNIAAHGWRYSLTFAGIVSIITAVVCFFLIRKSPAEMGLEPYRETKNNAGQGEPSSAPALVGVNRNEAVKTVSFWLVLLFAVCSGLLASGVISQVPTYLTESGIGYASVMTTYSFVCIFAAILLGPVFDKVGLGKGLSVCIAFNIICFALLLNVAKAPALAYVAVICFSIGNSSGSIGLPLLLGNIFGAKDMGRIFGLANIAFYGGCMCGSLLASGIRTATGSYAMAWAAFIAVVVIEIISVIAALAAGKKIIKT